MWRVLLLPGSGSRAGSSPVIWGFPVSGDDAHNDDDDGEDDDDGDDDDGDDDAHQLHHILNTHAGVGKRADCADQSVQILDVFAPILGLLCLF